MNTEFKGTKGKIESIYMKLSKFTLSTVISGENVIAHINSENVSPEECKANGELFADAGNTIQSCGLLPSELLKQSKIDEAFKVLLEHISDLQHSKDSTSGLLVTDNKKDYWTL